MAKPSLFSLLASTVLLFTLFNLVKAAPSRDLTQEAVLNAEKFFGESNHAVEDIGKDDIDFNELGRYIDSPATKHFRHVADSFSSYSLVITTFDAVAYAHLLLLTSKSKSYLVELIQLIAFICFPALPTIQLFNNALKSLSAVFMGTASGLRYTLSSICGQHVFPPSESFRAFTPRNRLIEVPTHAVKSYTKPRLCSSWITRLILILFTLVTGILGIVIHRFETHSHFTLAAIGTDRRQGLMAISGALCAILALLIHACHTHWSIAPASTSKDHNRDDPALSILWESEIFTEIASAAILQDSLIGLAGGRSFTGKIAVFMANRFILATVFIAFILFHRYLKMAAGWVLGPQAARSRTLRPLAVVFSLSVCGLIVVLQGFTAVVEWEERSSTNNVKWSPLKPVVHT